MEINFFTSKAFLFILKTGILIILAFYVIFALIIIRQVDLMRKTLVTVTSEALSILSIAHAGFAVGLFILAWVIL